MVAILTLSGKIHLTQCYNHTPMARYGILHDCIALCVHAPYARELGILNTFSVQYGSTHNTGESAVVSDKRFIKIGYGK